MDIMKKKPWKEDDDNLAYLGKERSTLCLKLSWFLIGIGFLFPYNSVVTAIDFFGYIYFEAIDFMLGWLLLLPSMIILVITLKYGYWGSIYQRIIGTFLLSAILTIIIPLVRNVYIVFLGTFILGCLSAILQGTLFSLLGFMGPEWMSITQTGIGCSGVLVGIVRIVTKLWIPSDIRDSTYLYFLMAFIMVIIDIGLYILILHPSKKVQKAIYEDTMKNKSLHALKQANKSKSDLNINSNNNKRTMSHNEVSAILDDKQNNKNYRAINNSDRVSASSGDYKEDEQQKHAILIGSVDDDKVPLGLLELFGVTWRCQVAVFLNYTLTLSLFPGVMSLMKWDDSNDEWFAVIQIFLFNLFDTIGKNLTTYQSILNLISHKGLLMMSIGRLVFIPLFVMCVKPQIFSWQIAIIINALMGISNGLVGTSGFCLGPSSPNLPQHEKGRTGQMLAVALTSGLVVGSSSAFLINFIMNNYL